MMSVAGHVHHHIVGLEVRDLKKEKKKEQGMQANRKNNKHSNISSATLFQSFNPVHNRVLFCLECNKTGMHKTADLAMLRFTM